MEGTVNYTLTILHLPGWYIGVLSALADTSIFYQHFSSHRNVRMITAIRRLGLSTANGRKMSQVTNYMGL
jgi:hypothetical protein